jgi:hypothetical protein
MPNLTSYTPIKKYKGEYKTKCFDCLETTIYPTGYSRDGYILCSNQDSVPLIRITNNEHNTVFIGTFEDVKRQLTNKPTKTIYSFYIDTEVGGMYVSDMFDDYDKFISGIKSRIVSWSAPFGDDPIAMEYYTQIANATQGQTNYGDSISLSEDEDCMDQITINIQTF